MTTLLASFLIIALAVAGLAVGVMLGRQPIRGSCGGLGSIRGLEGSCGACGGKQCRRRREGSPEE